MSDLYRLLSNVFVINSAAFAKAKPVEQTATLSANTGLPVLFVENFQSLSDKRKIRDSLLAGKDVSMELEFNGIELTDEDRRVLNLVAPILDKITGISGYEWVTPPNGAIGPVCGTSRVQRIGYSITVEQAKTVWNYASRIWGGGHKQKPPRIIHDYTSRTVTVTDDLVTIGCQAVARWEVEAVAQHYGWEPNL